MMKMPASLKGKNGVTLIELLVVLVISSIIVAALYRTFIGQQKTYTVQEQVIDIQQNARVAINKMISDIRMAGFGNFASALSPSENVLRPNWPEAGALTISSGESSTVLKEITAPDKIKVLSNVFTSGRFSIGGVESHNMEPTAPPTQEDGLWVITLKKGERIMNSYPVNTTQVYDIGGITYQLVGSSIQRNGEIMADNIESLQFRYYTSPTDEVGTDAPANPQDIQRIRVTVIARTSASDPDYKGGDGFRRRQISSYIMIRNPIKH